MLERGMYHHATAEAIREGLLYYVSIDTEPIADAVADSLAEDLRMEGDRMAVAEILAHVGLGPDELQDMVGEGLRRLAATAAAKLGKEGIGDTLDLPDDCREPLKRLQRRAWEKAAEEAAETGNGRYPPAHLRSQLGRAAWDGDEDDAPITGREAIEIHLRTPGSRLLARKPDSGEPISVDDAWQVIEDDPGAVCVIT